MAKRVLLLSTRTFWPTNSGKDITLYYNCKGLAQTYGYDLYVYCFTNTVKALAKDVPAFLKDVKYATCTNKKEVVKNILVHSLYKQDWSLQSALYYGHKREHEIQAYYDEVQPDVLIFDMIRLLPYKNIARQHTSKKIMFIDDLLSKRYAMQLARKESKANVCGQFAQHLPALVTKVSNVSYVRKALLKQEIDLIQKEEQAALHEFDYVTFVSPLEQQEYNTKHATEKGKVLSMGVDYAFYAQAMHVQKEAGGISFVGNFHVASNYDSIVYIIEHILARLPASTILKAIGSYPSVLGNKYHAHPSVQFLGRVEDVRREVLKTHVFVSPIVYGTGIKTKIVEAMAMGMPVVTNGIGAEGICAQNGRDWIVEDSEEGIVSAIQDLLHNEEKARHMGTQGQRYVQVHHQWKKMYQVFDEMGLQKNEHLNR